jgi:hypothetical protein
VCLQSQEVNLGTVLGVVLLLVGGMLGSFV